MAIKEIIRKVRIGSRLTSEEFANYIGVSISSLSRYQNGHQKPTMKTIRKIMELAEKNNIDIKIEDFFNTN